MNGTRLTLAAVIAMGAVGCAPAVAQIPSQNQSTPAPERTRRDPVIRAYDVPEGSAARYQSMTQALLRRPEHARSLGRVAIAPDGRLVVLAPASVHEDLAPLFTPSRVLPVEPAAVALTYWVVGARPATPAPPDPALAEIGDSLTRLSEEGGGLAFRLLDRVAVQSSTESRASYGGQQTQVEQSLRSRGGLLLADLEIHTKAVQVGPLHTSITIVPDEAIVLGETSVSEDGGERLIYLVRATVR